MSVAERTAPRVGYVLKKYPRLSETFILNEILGLEELGLELSIHSLNPCTEARFHADIGRVRAEVDYLPPLKTGSVAEAFAEAARRAEECGASGLTAALDFARRCDPEKGILLVLHALHLCREVRERRLDHLHAHFMTIAARVCHLVHLLSGTPFSVTAHAKDIFRDGVDAEIFAEITRAAAAIITVTDFNRAYIAERFLGGDPSGVRRIWNGLPLDDAVFRPGPAEERERDLVLGVGRLVEKKGFDAFLSVIAALRDGGREVRAVLVGDGEDAGSLRRRARDLGLADSVSFTGALPREEVVGLMRRARVLLAPCREGEDGNRDALPTVLIEALALGLPAVSTRLNGIPEIVGDGEQGLLLEPDDVEGMAGAVARLLDDDATWSRFAAAAPTRARERFDRARTLPQVLEVFRASIPTGGGVR